MPISRRKQVAFILSGLFLVADGASAQMIEDGDPYDLWFRCDYVDEGRPDRMPAGYAFTSPLFSDEDVYINKTKGLIGSTGIFGFRWHKYFDGDPQIKVKWEEQYNGKQYYENVTFDRYSLKLTLWYSTPGGKESWSTRLHQCRKMSQEEKQF